MLNFQSSLRFVRKTDTGSKSWDEGAKDFGFATSGKMVILKEETAPRPFLLEGNPGKAGDGFLCQRQP